MAPDHRTKAEATMIESSTPKKKFHHIGLRTHESQALEHYIAPSQCWITNPNRHPQHIEYLRYGPSSPIAQEFMNAPHVAYEVEELSVHLEGKDVYLEPFEVGEPPFATVALRVRMVCSSSICSLSRDAPGSMISIEWPVTML